MVIATPEHRQALRDRLLSWELEDAFLGLDAQQTLDRFMVDGLWKQRNTAATLQLEELWNGLQQHVAVPLLCAYPVQDMTDQRGLAAVCEAHTHVLPVAA